MEATPEHHSLLSQKIAHIRMMRPYNGFNLFQENNSGVRCLSDMFSLLIIDYFTAGTPVMRTSSKITVVLSPEVDCRLSKGGSKYFLKNIFEVAVSPWPGDNYIIQCAFVGLNVYLGSNAPALTSLMLRTVASEALRCNVCYPENSGTSRNGLIAFERTHPDQFPFWTWKLLAKSRNLF